MLVGRAAAIFWQMFLLVWGILLQGMNVFEQGNAEQYGLRAAAERRSVSNVSGSDSAGQSSIPCGGRAAAGWAPEGGEMVFLPHLLLLVLSTAKAGCCIQTPAFFLLWFSFKMRLKSEEPNTQAPGERAETLSPTSVTQDGIYDL